MPALVISHDTVSSILEEDFVHSVLHGQVLLVECSLETENICRLQWLVASHPALTTSDSQGRTSKPFIFCSCSDMTC